MAKLTDKQEMFCREYLVDLNATQAAIRAGYSPNSAQQTASENLSKPVIQERISLLMHDRQKRLEVDTDYVLRRLIEIDQLDIIDILNEHGGVKPISEWTNAWRRYVSSIEITEMTLRGDMDERQITDAVLKKIKWPDKVKNLELLGKHTSVQAWNDRIETHVTSYEDILDEVIDRKQKNI